MSRSEGDNQHTLSGDYIAGLTDGEGCFYVNVYERDKSKYPRASAQIKIHFYIKLREDDLEVLQKVKSSLGLGFIYFQNEKRLNHSSCYRFEVNSLLDWGKLISFFEVHKLQSHKKQKDFLICKEIYKIMKSGHHLTLSGKEEIRRLKSQMH